MKKQIVLIAFATVLFVTTAFAGEVDKEDLSACKLPNGEILIPDRNSPEGQTGYILRFSDKKLNLDPFKVGGEQPKSAADFLERLRAENTGDLIFSPLNGTTLIAVSGRIADLGKHFLHEFSGTKLIRPEPVQGIKERNAKGEGTPGAIEGASEGNCYLLETTEGKFALVRLVEVRGRLALIQYVYQPDGSHTFDIPKGDVIKLPATQGNDNAPKPVVPMKVEPAAKPVDLPALFALREKAVAQLLAIVEKEAKTESEIAAKLEAITALGRLRASEAVPVLIKEINFRKPNAPMRGMSIHALFPCVPALAQIGKPASLAALDAIGSVTVEEDADKKKVSEAKLLCFVTVLRDVEGLEVGEFMLQRKMEKAPVEKCPTYELALKLLQK